MISTKFNETELNVGDTVRVHTTVIEGAKTRTQVFEGILIAMNGRGENQMITVRRVGAGGKGIERMWPVNAKSIVKIEVKKKGGKIRRSKLYFLREKTGRQAVRV